MIGYITLGTKDLAKAAAFYDELFAILGAKKVYDLPRFVAWAKEGQVPLFGVTYPYDGNVATVGNGVMIALSADNTNQVDVIHAQALALGGTNEGAPGLRKGGYYCGYFRDLDGNKLNIYYADQS